MVQNSNNILPASGHDICNYFARHGLANFQIQIVLKLDGKVDFDKLITAVKLSIEEEPVLGCRFIEGDPPYWKRIKDSDEERLCSIEVTNNPDRAVKLFYGSPLDMDKDLNVKIKLIRSEDYDTICIKINHACCDGAGAKEYIHLLSKIYSFIDCENATYIPHPKIGGRKDQEKLFDTLGIKHPVAGWNPLKDAPRTVWGFPWKQGRLNVVRFNVCRLPDGQVDILSEYGKSKGTTVNDIILTAYYRAMFEFSQPPYGVPMDISTTIDLRRYIPDQKAEAIRNFSGGFRTGIARKVKEPFEGTLSRVVHATRKIKDGLPGLQNAKGGEFVEILSFPMINAYFKLISQDTLLMSQLPFSISNMCCTPGLSNLAYISRSLLKFGENVVTDAYVLPPVVRAPGLLLLACTYNGILTLSFGYYKGSLRRKDADRLLNKIKEELMGASI